jgi:cytochrome c oxidase subunit II
MDYPRSWQVLFQKPATTMMEGIIDLHHDIFTFLVIILTFVSLMLLTILVRFVEKEAQHTKISFNGSVPFMKYKIAHGVTHHTVLETVWTIIPTLILLVIATPSFALIYALDEVVEPQLTLRVVGRQWYWTYEYPDTVPVAMPAALDGSAEGLEVVASLHNHEVPASADLTTWSWFTRQYFSILQLNKKNNLVNVFYNTPGFSFNSYLIPTEDLFEGSFRLLEVTRRVVLPVLTNVRLLVTSYDVIHSWAVPAFGVKVDALPGRLNEYFLHVNYLGIFYGQCSEICGVNHGFMPIKVEVTTEELFKWWYLETSLGENVALKFRDAWQLPELYQNLWTTTVKHTQLVSNITH